MTKKTIAIIGGISVLVVILLIIIVVVSLKQKQSEELPFPSDYKNQNTIVNSSQTPGQTQQQNLPQYQLDPLTQQLNASITEEITSAPKPVKYTLKDAVSSQLNLDIVPAFTELKCKNADKGSFITQLDVYSGQYVDGLNIKCSNDETKYQKIGGSGGDLNPIISEDKGFNKLIIKSGKWIDSISFVPQGTQTSEIRGGGGGGGPYVINCGVNGKLVGFKGTSGNFINQLDGICATPEQ